MSENLIMMDTLRHLNYSDYPKHSRSLLQTYYTVHIQTLRRPLKKQMNRPKAGSGEMSSLLQVVSVTCYTCIILQALRPICALQTQPASQAPTHPSGLVAPYPRSCVNQSERFRAMPSVIMSTMNLSFAQPAQTAGKTRQPQAWDTLVNNSRTQTSS